MNKKIIIFLVLLISLAAILSFYKNNLNNNSSTIVGGDRDTHGCIGSAGYSWCEVKNKCLRIWEEKCEISIDNTSTSTRALSQCAQKEGVWYPKEKICEANQLSKSQCIEQEGEFNECASACRHDPEAQVCTMQCVLTCTFK
jgi:hypothetical protein